MRSMKLHHLKTRSLVMIGVLALAVALLSAGSLPGYASGASASTTTSPSLSHRSSTASVCCRTPAELALYTAMMELWTEHMEWTYATVSAFASGKGLTPTLTRLLQDQTDIGNAIKPYYGAAADNELSRLLHAHIMGYVPLLEAAKAGNAAKVKSDFAAILANGVRIGKFLHAANAKNWSAVQMGQMMSIHNRQTLQYASDLLKGDYRAAIVEYGRAEAHMWQMARMLTNGIIAQFPQKFAN